MGGPGKPGTTTPEDLFAAGHAFCPSSRAIKGNVEVGIKVKALP